jgi:RNA polymerase sigma-70 factor (ECF subfamily)
VNPRPDEPIGAVATTDPGETLDLVERGRALREALCVLSPDERRAIETAFFSEMTYAEAATRLNQPLGTVKTRIRAGLGKLRQRLKEK